VRDPLASNLATATEIRRQLYHQLTQDHFLYSPLSRQLVAREELLEFSFSGAREIVSPRIPFVSYPDEWCNAQLIDAADLTLTVSEKVLPARVEIKDASAWNIIFDGCKPVFCDHLSFQTIESQRWWAFGQYIRHFILPLCLAKYCDLDTRNSFKIARDGVTPEFARNLIGAKRFPFFIRHIQKLLAVSLAGSQDFIILGRDDFHLRWILPDTVPCHLLSPDPICR